MNKITAEHLKRSACVYIRQSTPDQLVHNLESQRRQYGLADRARQLGWTTVQIIDDDLGRSGGGIARPGFERLLAAICDGRVGAVLAIEASRLARNGRDWHTLIEFCGLVGAIIVDEDGTYDPRHPNDRLLLGMKGTMSELELSLFRQRSQEALRQKARRGALVLGVAAGYVKVGRDRIEKNPDRRVQQAIQLVFTKFAEFLSARQVHIWLRDEGIELPAKSRRGEAHGVVWRLPAYNIVHNILTNPIYAGAYAFGRTTSRVSVMDGRKHVRRGVHRPMAQWDVLIKDHHAAYITWDEFERNLKAIASNATGMSSALARGAAREGELLLPGLLRCGHCGRKLHVHYGGKLGRYNCYGARMNHGTERCISVSGLSIDAAIVKEVLRVLKPLGIEAAVVSDDHPMALSMPEAGAVHHIRAPPRASGWRTERPIFCRCPTTTSYSHCRRRSALSHGRTRPPPMAFCSRRRPRPCSPLQPIPGISAPGSASRRYFTLGDRRSPTIRMCL